MLLLALGCSPVVTGRVESAGKPVAGAVLSVVTGEPCDAVTDSTGAFRTRCASGARTVRVTHPGHLEQIVSWEVSGPGEAQVASVALVAIPTAPGLHLSGEAGFTEVAPGPFVRLGSATTGWRWCMDKSLGSPMVVAAGTLRFLDNHDRDWRIYRLDTDACAFRLTATHGGFFEGSGDRVDVQRISPFAPGRDWVEATLPAGDYALADWFASGFVADGDRWRGAWLRVE